MIVSYFNAPECSYAYVGECLMTALANIGYAVEGAEFSMKGADLIIGPLDWVEQNQFRIKNNTVVFTMSETEKLTENQIRLLNNVAKVVVPSYWCASCFNLQLNKPVYVCPLGHDIPTYAPESYEPFVFFVADSAYGYSGRKNISHVIQAFRECAFDKGVELWVRTSAPYIGGPGIKMLPWQTRPDYIDTLSRVSCGICISAGEGFGLTPLELSALGKPCITMGTPPVVEHTPAFAELKVSHNGSLTPIKESLVKAMLFAVEDAHLSAYGHAAWCVAKKYSWHNSAKRLSELAYKEFYL